MSKILKVAVIGVGPTGIGALRQMSQYPDVFEPVAFEKNQEVGGLWNYTDYTEKDEYGLPCYASLYKQLRTNLPTCLMSYPDQEYPNGLTSYVGYKVIKDYMDDYCEKYDLNKYCKFQTIVKNVTPKTTSDGLKWLVISRDLTNDVMITDVFDAVIVCNGEVFRNYQIEIMVYFASLMADYSNLYRKENVPNIPKYPGIEQFKGIVIHTKNIRDLDEYRGKTILLVGAAFSARDIIFEMKDIVIKMYVTNRGKDQLPFKLPENVYEVPEISRILPIGVILKNDECREVDTIIFATGYIFNFPFLSDAIKIKTDRGRVQPIYNHMFHIDYPSLCFISILKDSVVFHLSILQAEYICMVLQNKIKLPTQAEMYRQEEEYYQKKIVQNNQATRLIHNLILDDLRQYVQRLQAQMGKTIISNVTLDVFDAIVPLAFNESGTYKQMTVNVKDGDFEINL